MIVESHRTLLTGPAGKAGPFVYYGLALFASLFFGSIAEAQIGISPPRTEFYLDGPSKTHSIRIFNVGEKAVEIAVEVSHWDLDENNKVRIIPPTEQSLDQWLVINPLRFTLEAGGSQAVRFAARPRVEPEPGEHRALVYFQQVPDPPDPAAPARPQVLFRFGTSVIGLAEPVVRDAAVHSATADAATVNIDVESRGNTHVRLEGQWAIWLAERFPGHGSTELIEDLGEDEGIVLPEGMVAAGPLSPLPILPSTRRVVTTYIGHELEPGSYILDLHGTVTEIDFGRTFAIEVPETAVVEEPVPPDDRSGAEPGTADPPAGSEVSEPFSNE